MFDSHGAPSARIVARGQGRAIPFPLHGIAQIVGRDDMPCRTSLFDSEIPPQSPGAPPHTHANEDEVYVILEGRLSFLLGDVVATAGPGDTVILPRGIPHATWNAGDQAVRALTFVSQDSEFEFFFDRVAARMAEENAQTPAEGAALVGEVSASIGVTIDMSLMPDEAKPFFGMA